MMSSNGRVFLRGIGVIAMLLVAGDLPSQTLDAARELHRGGQIDRALEAYASVAAAAREADPPSAAIALNNSCLIRYGRGEIDAALALCSDALAMRRLGEDARGTSRTLNNLGLVLESLGRHNDAENRFSEALVINTERDDLEAQAINLGNLAKVSMTRGDYGLALLRLDEVERRIATESDDSPQWVVQQLAYNRLNQAVALEKIGLYEEALTTYLDVDEEALEPADRSTVALNRGVVFRNLGDPYLALESFELVQQATDSADPRTAIFATLNSGIVLDRNLDRVEEAKERYEEALVASRRVREVDLELKARLYLAEMQLRTRDNDLSAALFTDLADAARSHGVTEGIWRALYGAGRYEAEFGDPEAARRHFSSAIEFLGTVRDSVEGSHHGDLFQGIARPVYVDAVENLIDLGEIDAAFRVVQLGKRRYRNDLETPTHPSKIEIVDSLGGATLLEYFIGNEDLFRWFVSEDGVELHRIGHFGPIADRIESLHRRLSRSEPLPQDQLSELSNELLGGLNAETLGARVFVAPDGRLGYLPFELLLLESGEPLIDTAHVSYLPSGSALKRRPAPVAETALRFAGLANPSFESGQHGIAARNRISRLGLGPLPGAARELARALETLPEPSLGFTAAEATEGALSRIADQGTAILHLGTHTLIEEGAGTESAILLAASDESDGLLLPSEIAELDLSTGLTVLAGCRTAIGFDDRSTALSDLAGAFLASGSNAVLATLWEVGDQPTEQFMRLFYDAIRDGESPTDSLRAAKQALRGDPAWNQPHLWSAYVLIGRGDTPVIPAPKTPGFVYGLVLVAVALAAGALIARSAIAHRRNVNRSRTR